MMMRTNGVILSGLLILCFYLDCPGQKKPKPSETCISERENDVYELVGVGNYQNETSGYLSGQLVAQLGDISPETVADFNDKNARTYLLRCVDKLGGKTVKLRRSTGGNASTSFSRIGFNRDGSEALVYHYWEAVGNYCGGEFVLLRRKADKWEIVKKVMTVIC
jgi:hypothetical protein